MLSAMAGFDPNDPSTLSAPVGDYAAGCGEGINALRIGVDPAYVYEGTCDDVAAAVREAEQVLASAGAELRQVTVPPYRDAVRGWSTLLNIQVAHAHSKTYPARAAEYGSSLAGVILAGHSTSIYEVADRLLAKAVFTNRLAAVFDDVDVILVPVTPSSVLTRREMTELRNTVADEFIKYTCPFNLSGYPTITLPAGFDQKGLPIGIQLVGPSLSESTLCRAGAAFQRLTDWHTRHPVE
jgi:amidase